MRRTAQSVYVAPEVLLDNRDIAQVGAKKDKSGQVLLVIELTPTGTARLMQASLALVQKRMAVLIDAEVFSAEPVIAPLSGNRFAVMGLDSLEQAQQLAQGILLKR